MALVPAGKRRIMVSQRFDASMQPMQSPGFDDIDTNDAQSLYDPTATSELEGQAEQAKVEQEMSEEISEPNLVKHISDFLISLGYHPRRLQEFKSQFVEETGSAGGSRQVTVTLPDQIYGKDSPIPMSKLKEFVKSTEDQFALYFENYKRSDQKLILSFISSDDKQRRDAEETETPGDILDEVYKSPSSKDPTHKGADLDNFTMKHMIKESKNNLVMSLLKILEKNNASPCRKRK